MACITLDLLRNLFNQHFVDYPLLRNCLDILLRTGGMICLMKLLCPPLFLLQCIIYYCVMMCNLYVYFFCFLIKVDIVPAPVTKVNGYFTGTSPSFAGLSNKPVVCRRARVGTRPIFPEHSTLGHASSRLPRAFNFRGCEK